jgi:hypothetical protein
MTEVRCRLRRSPPEEGEAIGNEREEKRRKRKDKRKRRGRGESEKEEVGIRLLEIYSVCYRWSTNMVVH